MTTRTTVTTVRTGTTMTTVTTWTTGTRGTKLTTVTKVTTWTTETGGTTLKTLTTGPTVATVTTLTTGTTGTIASSETQGQSVGSGESARRKVSSKGGRAPRYRLSPDHFQKFKRMPAPDWAQKCFVLLCPIGEQFLLSSFREFVHDGYCLDHGLSGSCTKEMHAVRKLSV